MECRLFSSKIDVNKLLDSNEQADRVPKFASIDEFEAHLMESNVELVERLLALDAIKRKALPRRLPIGGERQRRLQTLCDKSGKAGVKPLSEYNREFKPSRNLRTPPVHLTQSTGRPEKRRPPTYLQKLINNKPKFCAKAAALGPLKKLSQWINQQQRVQIVLRGHFSPNAVITAAVIAFDKHWNLLIRDGDELFIPSVRQDREVREKMSDKRPCYYRIIDRSENKRTVWRRHLKCSIIRGEDIVMIREFGVLDFRKSCTS